jgi:hypothetical protein
MAPIANLTVRISAQIAELQKSFADANKATETFQKNFAGMATAAATVGTFLGNVFTKIASSIVSTLGGAIADAVKYAQQFQNAFLGLGSVAGAFGVKASDATAAAQKLSSDGLLPLKDSATGLKNLLSSGFNLEQSTRLMEAFKDSAAFGRSGALSFGDAVRSATEGVKNQNSVLVDNAGVTKNLSIILKEHGYKLEDLSDKVKGAGARQALYNGILQETAAQTGDAAKASGTYTGAMAALDTAYVSALATMGEAITKNQGVQIALSAVADALRNVTEWMGKNQNGSNLVTDALVFLIETVASLIRGFDKLQTGLAEMDKALSGFVRGAIVGVEKLTDLLLDLLKIAVKVPGVAKLIGFSGYGDEVASIILLNTKARTTQKQMADTMAETQTNSTTLSKTLQGLATTVDGVAAKVKAAKGQLGELGEATAPDKVDRGGLDALAKKADKLKKAFPPLISQFEIADAVLDRFGANLDEISIKKVGDLPPLRVTLKNETKIPLGQITRDVRGVVETMADAFVEVFADLPNVIRGVLTRGGGIGDVLAGVAGVAAQQFSKTFADALARSKTVGGAKLTGGEKALGLAGMGFESFVGGFDIGRSQGKAKGALGGAASGALAGAAMGSVVPGIGTLVGGVIGGAAGLFGGLFGGAKKAKEERKQLEANKAALLEQYGGMEKLRTLAGKLGVDISKAFDAKKPAQFTAAVDELNDALEDQKTRIAGLNTALKGVNDRAAIFADRFGAVFAATQGTETDQAAIAARARATAQLQAMAQASEGEFGRLGLMVRDTFAGLVKETGSGIAALQQMAPAFQMLEDGVSKWGLTSTAVIDELRSNFQLVNDQAFKPLFESIASSGEVLRGLFDAKALSPEGFQAIAADIGLSIQGIVDKGGDMAKTLALSQPVLQTLWEAQRQYGAVTDDTTAAILQQAEEQGLVGAQMQDVNQQILDVLLAIGDVLGATLPEYFEQLKAPAADAAQSIEDSFSDIRIDPLTIKVNYDAGELPAGMAGLSVPALAGGGIVRRPTLALIGEAGPEAVVPLSGPALGASSTYDTTIVLDGEVIAKSTARRIPRYLREMGVGH